MTVNVTAYDSSNNIVTGYSDFAGVYLDTWGTTQSFSDNLTAYFTNGVASFQVNYTAPAPTAFPFTGYYIVVNAPGLTATSFNFNVYAPLPPPGPTPAPLPVGPPSYLTVSVPAGATIGGIATAVVDVVDANGNLVTTYNDPVALNASFTGDNNLFPIFAQTTSPIVNGTGTVTFYVSNPEGASGNVSGNYSVEVFNNAQTLIGWTGTLPLFSPEPPLPPTPTPTPAPVSPVITGQPASLSLIEGQPASFSVTSVAGRPSPGIQWQQSTDDGATWSNLSNGGAFSGVTAVPLLIKAAAASMSGDQFRVVLSNASGTATSPAATLTVTPIPLGETILYDFTTFAGTPGQIGSADGKGSQAQFSSPFGIAVDSAGIVYVADTGNSTIRRIAPDGTVTTIAGKPGKAGSLDGVVTSALFKRPEALCPDLLGGLYIADTGNYTIRYISSTGVVSTPFGVPGVSAYSDSVYFSGTPSPAEFVAPRGIAVTGGFLDISDGSGIRYTVGSQDFVINQSVLVANGQVYAAQQTHFGPELGTAAGRVLGPGFQDGYDVDQGYFSNSYTPPQSLLSSPLGVVSSGSGGPGGDAGSSYIADSGNSAIRFLDYNYEDHDGLQVWGMSTVLGGPDKVGNPLTTPAGLARDSAGDLFITDVGSQAIFELSASGAVTQIGGSGTAGHSDGNGSAATFNGPYGIAVDSAGTLYIADTKNHTIRKGVPHINIPPPVIDRQPVSQMVPLFSPVTMSVVANGPPGLTFQWYFNGVRMPGATSANYVISRALLTNTGFYNVIVSSGGTFLLSQTASLVVSPTSPTFSVGTSSTSLETSFGSTVAISASVGPAVTTLSTLAPRAVEVASAYSYQWYLNGTALADGGGVSGSQSALLVLSGGSAEPGNYNCLVSSSTDSELSPNVAVTIGTADQPSRLINMSCRGLAGTGPNSLIAGFVVGGNGTSGFQHVLVRASGPALTPFGVTGALPDPTLKLYSGSSGASLLASDASWGGAASISGSAARVGAFAWTDATSKDSALLETLTPGPYTANLSGASGDSGVALAEVYDETPIGGDTSSTPRLINLSARNMVGSGTGTLIAGFVISGTTSKTVLIRASGPALIPFGLSGTLSDPLLQLFGSNPGGGSTLIQSDAGWGGSPQIASIAASVGAFSWGTSATADSAIVVTLPPGAYTAEVSGATGDTGIALVEVYEVP